MLEQFREVGAEEERGEIGRKIYQSKEVRGGESGPARTKQFTILLSFKLEHIEGASFPIGEIMGVI